MKHLLITIVVVLLVGCAHGTVPRKAITSDNAPAALGPYSPGVQVGEFLFLSGQIGLNPESGKLVEGGIKEQTKQVLDNLGAVLKEAGMDYENVVRATVYLSDMNNFQSMNSVYSGYFNSPHPPSRSTVEVRLLPKGALVEIDLIAME
tara:strand:+ start:574 stop:1017 length:444 start_codon:yes stop_codon:yes gene_type:complete